MTDCNCNAEEYEGCHKADCPAGICENEEYYARYSGLVKKCVSCGQFTIGKCGDIPTCERCYKDGTLRKWMDERVIE